MTTVASLTIEMAANVARLQADMARAANTVQSATAKMQKAAETAGRALGAIGAGLTVAAFTGFIRGAINAADETSKLSQKIGVTVKDVAGLQLAFRQAGVSQEAMATGLARLSKGIAEGNDGIKALGISTKNSDGTLKTSRQVLAEVADQFAKTGDGATKTARAQEIFGKTGADLIPLLNAGSQALDEYDALASKLGLTLSDETAKQAEQFNDTLDLVGQGVQGVGRQVAAQLLPTLTGLASEFFNSATIGDKLKKTADFLASGFKVLYIAGISVVEVFSSVGKVLGAVSAAAVAAFRGDFSEARSILGEMVSDIGTGWKDTLGQIDRAWNTTGDTAISSLAGIKKAQMATIESTDAAKKALEEYAKLVKTLQGDIAKALAESEAAQNSYNKAQQEFVAFARSEAFAKLTADQKRFVTGLYEQKIAIEQNSDAQREFIKALEESESARVKGLTAADETIAKLEENNKSLREEIELIGLNERQQLAVVQARNESAIAIKSEQIALLQKLDIGREEQTQLADEIRLLQERNQLLRQKLGAQEAADIYTNLADEGKRFVADLERGLTDSLFRAFEAGKGFFKTLWDGIRNLFKTTVLKAIIQPVVGGITGALGLTSAANAATTGGGIGNLLNLGSNLSTAYSALTGSFITSIGSAATAAGNLFGSTAIAEFGLGLQGLALPSSTGALAAGGSTASALSGAAAAGPYVLAAVAALNALGVFRSRKIVDGGLQGELGGQVNDYALERRGGTLFNGPSYRVLDRGASAQNDELQKAYNAIRTTVAGMAEQLGIGNAAIKDFTVQLGNDLIHPDTGGFGIKTQGLTQDEIVKKIEAALVSANEQLAEFALGTTEFTRDGETAAQTMARLAGSLQTVNGTFDLLGLTLADASLAGADAASKFVELFGGVEQFGQVTSSYYANFYTDAERTANTVEALRQRFFELGTAGATTREEFRAMVEEQQRLHGATAPVVAELLKLESTFASVVPAIDAVSEASAKQAEQAKLQAATISSERSDRLRIERETAAAAKAASEELAKLNEQNYRLAISAGNVSAALAARGNTGQRFADFQGANGFNAAGYNLASIFSQQRRAEEILAETRRQNPFAVADFFGVVRELEGTIASLQENIDSGEFSGGVSSTEKAAQAAFGDFLSPDQIQAAADGLTSFSNVLSLVTGTAQAGALGADQALRVLEGAYTGASKQSVEYARGLEIIGNSVGVFTGNVQDIQAAIKAGLDYAASGEYYQAISQEALRQQVNFTSEAFRNLTARAEMFNLETGNLETSFDVIDGFIGRLKSVQDAFANAAGDRAVEAGLISGAAQRIAGIITTPVAEAARSVLADLPSFANVDSDKLRDISLLIKDLGQFNNTGLEQTFIRVSNALATGQITAQQYADIIDYSERVYLGASEAASSLVEVTSDVADVMRQRESLELRILQLQGNTAELRARELAALPESVRALQAQIYALEDAADAAQASAAATQAAAQASAAATQAAAQASAAATQAAAQASVQAEQDLQAERQRVANERLGIEAELLALLGNTAELRRRELAGLDTTNRALKEQVFALQDLKLANEAAAESEIKRITTASDAQKKLLQAQVSASQDAVNSLSGIYGSLQNALKATAVETDAVSRVRQAQARELLAAAVSATSQGQSVSGIVGLQDALDVVSQQQPQLFATFDEFLASQDAAASLIGQLSGNTKGQLSVAELTLQAAQDNITAIESSTQSIVDAIRQGTAATAGLGAALGVTLSTPSFPSIASAPSVSFAPTAGGTAALEALVVALTAEVTSLKVELQSIKNNTGKTTSILSNALGPDGSQPQLVEIAA